MIFNYLNFENKFKCKSVENGVIIEDTSNSKIAAKFSTIKDSNVLKFELIITEGYVDSVINIVYDELISNFKNSKATILETIVAQDNPCIEYLHSHNFQMMSIDNKFKLTYKPRSFYEL